MKTRSSPSERGDRLLQHGRILAFQPTLVLIVGVGLVVAVEEDRDGVEHGDEGGVDVHQSTEGLAGRTDDRAGLL